MMCNMTVFPRLSCWLRALWHGSCPISFPASLRVRICPLFSLSPFGRCCLHPSWAAGCPPALLGNMVLLGAPSVFPKARHSLAGAATTGKGWSSACKLQPESLWETPLKASVGIDRSPWAAQRSRMGHEDAMPKELQKRVGWWKNINFSFLVFCLTDTQLNPGDSYCPVQVLA